METPSEIFQDFLDGLRMRKHDWPKGYYIYYEDGKFYDRDGEIRDDFKLDDDPNNPWDTFDGLLGDSEYKWVKNFTDGFMDNIETMCIETHPDHDDKLIFEDDNGNIVATMPFCFIIWTFGGLRRNVKYSMKELGL